MAVCCFPYREAGSGMTAEITLGWMIWLQALSGKAHWARDSMGTVHK